MKNLMILAVFFGQFCIPLAYGSEANGFYSKGTLLEAQSVVERGTKIHKLFVARKRLFTSDEMHRLLDNASDFVSGNYPDSEVLQVGDLSMSRGGIAVGHASHQNGLDGDLVYLRKNKYVQSPLSTQWDEDFVKGAQPTKNFNVERNFALFSYLVSTEPVSRIFVDIAIKKALCQYVLNSGMIKNPKALETLRRLRPQDLHRTHFHLRISCPPEDYECVPQSEPPTGSGCDDLNLLLESAKANQTC